jgi:hypothetical protein
MASMIVRTRRVFAGSAGIVAAHVAAGAEAGSVVVVDLPENALSLVVEAAEIMLAVGVIVGCEGVEGDHPFCNVQLRSEVEGRGCRWS